MIIYYCVAFHTALWRRSATNEGCRRGAALMLQYLSVRAPESSCPESVVGPVARRLHRV